MTTVEVLIVSLAAVVIVAVVALAQWRIRVDEIAGNEVRARQQAIEAREAAERRAAATEAAAALPGPSGPEDGTVVGVHVGGQVVRGTRVLRGDAAAVGWIVLDDADLLDGTRTTPLGGRQWLPDETWKQEM